MITKQPALSILADGWDEHDAWGSTTTAALCLADVAGAAGLTEVWDVLEYTPGLAAPTSLHVLANALDDDDAPVQYGAMLLAAAYLVGDVSDADLLLAARVLARHLDACRNAGLAY